MNTKALLCLVLLVGFTNSNAASFDCNKAITAQEKIICATPTLSSLDEKLAQVYKDAMVNASDSPTVKSDQRAWLKDTKNCDADSSCLERAYELRIRQLTAKRSDIEPKPQPSAVSDVDASSSASPKTEVATPIASEMAASVVANSKTDTPTSEPSSEPSKEEAIAFWDSQYVKYGAVTLGGLFAIMLFYWLIKKFIAIVRRGALLAAEKSDQLKQDIAERATRVREAATNANGRIQEGLVGAAEKSAPHLQTLQSDLSEIKSKASLGMKSGDHSAKEKIFLIWNSFTSRQRNILKIFLIFIFGVIILNKINKFEDGEYVYESRVVKGEQQCSQKNGKCLTLEEYKSFCSNISSITLGMENQIIGLGLGGSAFGVLLKGGTLIDIQREWLDRDIFKKEAKILGACQVTLVVMGDYKGTSTKEKMQIYAEKFIVKNGEILMHSGSISAWML